MTEPTDQPEPLSDERRAVIEAVATDVDVMGGLGHPSMLTPEGLVRRHAAVLIRALADEVDRLRADLEAAAPKLRAAEQVAYGWTNNIEGFTRIEPPGLELVDRIDGWIEALDLLAALYPDSEPEPPDEPPELTTCGGDGCPGCDGCRSSSPSEPEQVAPVDPQQPEQQP